MKYQVITKDGRAKRARMETVHGVIETPVFMNVGTVGAIKGAVSTDDLREINTQVELSNTYHLHVRTGDRLIKEFGGLNRKSMTKEEYDTPEYRNLCKTLSAEVINDIVEYVNNDYKAIGIIGINHSPTCSISGKMGILMEEIFKLLDEKEITIPYIEVPGEYEDDIDSVLKINSELLTLI